MTVAVIEIRPLSAHTGAEIHGVDLREPLADEDYHEIRGALNNFGVIFFRDQQLDRTQQLAFARRFGPIYSSENRVHAKGDDLVSGMVKTPDQTRNIGGNWHTDQSFVDVPPLGSVLVARELPSIGGDTLFANMFAAYETLSDGLKEALEGMRAHHSKYQCYETDQPDRQLDPAVKRKLFNDLQGAEAVHCVICRHPESGRKFLYVNPTYTVRFEGWSEEESTPLLQYLYRHTSRPENTCRFHWELGSMAFWDNRSTWHYALNDYPGMRRAMNRVTVEGKAFG
jgi:taurine dioxygenase